METALNTAPTHSLTSSPLEHLQTRFRQYRTYRQTLSELSSLSDRALSDLGLSRAMIRSVARVAAYGA